MATTKSPRLRFLDYGKALILFEVAINHVGAPFPNNPSVYMLFFFFVTGYVHKGNRPVGDAIKRRFKGIVVPFWIGMLVLGLFEIPRALYVGYGDARIFLLAVINAIYGSSRMPYLGPLSDYVNSLKFFHGDSIAAATDLVLPLTCHLWFLPAMFVASAMFYVYATKLRKGWWTDLIAIVVMCVLAWTETLFPAQYPFGFGRACWGFTAMLAGLIAKEKLIFSTPGRTAPVFCVSLALAVLAVFAGCTKVYPIINVYGDYGLLSVFVSVIGGVSGSIVFCYVLQLLERMLKGHDETLCLLGRNTLPLYLWHMLVLNVLMVIVLTVTGTAPSPDFFKVTLLPNTWYLCGYIVAVLSILIVMGGVKLLKRDH